MSPGNGAEATRATRSSLASALLAIVAPGDPALAAEPAPETLLECRRLKRSGMLYVVDAESDFVAQVDKLQPSFQELKATYDKLFAVVQNQAEHDFLNDQWTLCNEQLRNVQAEIDAHPPLNNNELRQNWNNLLNAEKQIRYQYNELAREVNLRYHRLVSEGEKERLKGEFQKKREDFLAKSQELRAQADKIKADYDAMSRDDAVKKALDALKLSTKAKVTLGPSPKFKSASAWLADAVRSTSPESLTTKAARKKVTTPKGKGTTPGKERSSKGATPGTRAKAPASGDAKAGTE
jgi:hypothetical protein